MRVPRVFHGEPEVALANACGEGPLAEALRSGRPVALPETACHYLSRVLRLEPGAELRLFDGLGGEYRARIAPNTAVTGRRRASPGCEVILLEHLPVERESPQPLCLALAAIKADRFEWVLQKATELGVAEVQPLLSARSVREWDEGRAAARRTRWQRIVFEACEQCGRNRLPLIQEPQSFEAWLQACRGHRGGWVLTPDADASAAETTRAVAAAVVPPALIIGPEGGLTADEVDLAQASGFAALRLGPRILRAETAAVAALAVLQSRLGGLD